MKPIDLRIAEELAVRAQQVAAAISLLDGGATVPFVARYRKEATGALDDASYVRLRSGCDICANWMSVGPPSSTASVSKENSTPRSSRRLTRPTPRHGSKISICPIGRNGGRRLKSRGKRGSSRWQTRFSRSLTRARTG